MAEPKPTDPARPQTLPQIVPEPPPEGRWTKAKMGTFLRELAATQSVAMAARAVGMSRQSAYKLRNRLKGEPFDIAWEAAFQHCYDALHQAALERALHGVEIPVYAKGELVGSRRHFDERLTVFLLSRRNAQGAQRLGRYGAAAEFWSERWDRMVARVEEGPVEWTGPELDAPGDIAGDCDPDPDAELFARLRDEERAASDALQRHALDDAEQRARFGRSG